MLNLIIFSSLFCIILSSRDCSELLQQWIKSWKQIRAKVDCMQLWWIAAYMHAAVFCCTDNNLHLALAHKLNTALGIMRGCRFKIDPVISVLQTSPHRCNYRAIISANIEADYCICGGCCKNKIPCGRFNMILPHARQLHPAFISTKRRAKNWPQHAGRYARHVKLNKSEKRVQLECSASAIFSVEFF